MTAIVQNVCKLSQQMFSNFLIKQQNNRQCSLNTVNNQLDDASCLSLMKLFSKITLNDIYYNLNELLPNSPLNHENKDLAPVTYTSIFENEFFSLTVFGFRHKNSIIPLHDHPGMHGFIKCVHGCISIKSYTVLNYSEPPLEILEKVQPDDHQSLVASIYLGEEIVSSDSQKIGTLTPLERNLHEIRPVTNNAVMTDIISPPYTECTKNHFYTIIGTVFDAQLNKNVTWLLKSLFNNDYYCDSLIYRGPNIFV